MAATIIDGKATAQTIRTELKAEVEALKNATGVTPGLAVIMVGDNPASAVYVRNKQKAAAEVGIEATLDHPGDDLTEAQLLDKVAALNADPKVHGILVQLPLPAHIDAQKVLDAIDPDKDVDGFHPVNAGRLLVGLPAPIACTPAGILELLERYHIPMEGKHAVVIGRSNIVGKPVSLLLLRRHATVTICHSRTPDLPSVVKTADILVAAVGRAKMVKGSWLKPGATVIDVGMNRDENGKLCGDVDFEEAKEVAGAITPVPGGVGPMTIAMLLRNTFEAAATKEGAV